MSSPLVIDASPLELSYWVCTVILLSGCFWVSSMPTSSSSEMGLLSLPCWAAVIRVVSMACTFSGLTCLILMTM